MPKQSYVAVIAFTVNPYEDETGAAYGPSEAQQEIEKACRDIGFEVEDVTVYERAVPPKRKPDIFEGIDTGTPAGMTALGDRLIHGIRK